MSDIPQTLLVLSQRSDSSHTTRFSSYFLLLCSKCRLVLDRCISKEHELCCSVADHLNGGSRCKEIWELPVMLKTERKMAFYYPAGVFWMFLRACFRAVASSLAVFITSLSSCGVVPPLLPLACSHSWMKHGAACTSASEMSRGSDEWGRCSSSDASEQWSDSWSRQYTCVTV